MLQRICISLVTVLALTCTNFARSDLERDRARELPILGDEASGILSPAEEDKIGKLFLFQLRDNLPLIHEPIVKYYAHKHALHLAQHSDLPTVSLHPVVINAKDFNAFAAPGGVIGINLGLFLFAEDVHEYSSVIAHELAHLSQRHYARRLEQQKSTTIKNIVGFMTSAAIIAAGATPEGFVTLVGAQSYLQNQALKYNRSQEREADRIGLINLERAGYDPHGAPRMFERMQTAFRFTEKPAEYMSTHPITQSRIADLRGQASEFKAQEFVDEKDFKYIRAWASRHFRDTKSVTEPEHSADDRFALALSLSAKSQYDEAIKAMKSLSEENPHSIIVSCAFAKILTESDRSGEALKLLDSKLADYPDNAPLTMYRVRALVHEKRYEEATEILWLQSRLRPDDQDVWLLLAETSGLAKKIIDVHRARAEALVLRGLYQAAIKQLQLAKGLAEDNFRLNASLDQRILDLRHEFEELES